MDDGTRPAKAGAVTKFSSIKSLDPQGDMELINAQALVPLDASQVFAFKVMAADNEADDRDHEPFTRKSLDDLAALYPGRPLIKDHDARADNQVGRVYAAEVAEDPSRKTARGEAHAELVLRVCMLRTEANKDLIADIEGGIKREVSTSFAVEHAWCSICGTDNAKEWCRHMPGRSYGETGAEKECELWFDGVSDAYELSLVAVPAQPRAGAMKTARDAEGARDKEAAKSETDAARIALLADIEGAEAFAEARRIDERG